MPRAEHMFYSGGGVPAEKARARWGMPATRSKVSGAFETGEGEQVPPPRQPLPPWRYPHGPAHGEILEKTRARWPTGYTPDTAAPLISPRAAPARGEAGEERRRRGRGGATWITVSGELETGEGEQVPPPRQPLPPWRYPYGPVPGDRWERAGYRYLPAPPRIPLLP